MLIHVKLTRQLFERMRADLYRPHDFAYERVGFVLARKDQFDKSGLLLLATEYLSVSDCNYIMDPSVGAKINSAAIRTVMERAYSTKQCILHLHQHDHSGAPLFSKVDLLEYRKIVSSFHNIGGGCVHGALLFSIDGVAGQIWTSKTSSPEPINKLSIVGYPMVSKKVGAGLHV